jgi:hypothetical protein
MGRAILLVVILVSTIYAGIIINVQKEMYKLPEVIVDNFISKQSENVNDYALRAAVRLGTEDYILITGQDTMTVNFNNYRQGNCEITKIFYRRMPAGYYEARTYIRGTLQGKELNYTGQIAYDYMGNPYDGPIALYNDYQAQTHNTDIVLPDKSEHPSGILMEGVVSAMPGSNNNIIHYSPHGLDKYFTGGGGSHKCLDFGAGGKTNGGGSGGAWIQVPNPNDPDISTLLDRLKNYNQFTISFYAIPKIKSGIPNNGAIFWAPSNPYNSKAGQPGYTRPSAAIWFDSYNATSKTVKMHFGVTVHDSTAAGTYMEITKVGCPISSNANNDPWNMYTLVFNNGTLSAYYNLQLIETKTAQGGFTTIMPNDFGFTLGMRDIRVDGQWPTHAKDAGTDYMFYNGLLDQISFWDRALSAHEIENWFNNYVDASTKYYIRD